MGRRVFQVLSVVLMVGMFVAVAYAAEDGEAEVVKKSWFDLFKSTGMVGILLVLTSMIGTALLIQYMVNLNEVKTPAIHSWLQVTARLARSGEAPDGLRRAGG